MLYSTAHIDLMRAVNMTVKKGYTTRADWQNAALRRYWGKQYADMPAWDEKGKTFEERAPRLILRLEKLFVDTVNSYLFGETRSPSFVIEGATAQAAIDLTSAAATIYTQSGLRAALTEIGRLGLCCASVAVGFHYARGEGQETGRYYCEIIQTGMCKPRFGRDDRARARELGIAYDDLLELDEYWMELVDQPDTGKTELVRHRRMWTPTQTIEYLPVRDRDATDQIKRDGAIRWVEDTTNTFTHDLGFVPVEWMPNGGFVAGDVDGFPLLDEPEWEICDAVNYTFSQTHRAIGYNQDPWLVFKNAKIEADSLKKGGGRTLSVNGETPQTPADAELLEMGGAGQELGMKFVDKARQSMAQIVQVVLHDPGMWSGALSGTALERLLAPMLTMVAELRGSYGAGLSRLMHKMLAAEAGGMAPLGPITVTATWGPLIDPTESDAALAISNAITALDAGLITFEMAVAKIAPYFGRDDAAEIVTALRRDGTTAPAQPGDGGAAATEAAAAASAAASADGGAGSGAT